MKKLLIVLLILTGVSLQAQVSKYRATHAALYSTEWTDWQPSDLLVTLDLDKKRVTIYSETTQEYDVIRLQDEVREENKSQFMLLCLDADGELCLVKFVFFDQRAQLYVHYNNVSWVYELKPI